MVREPALADEGVEALGKRFHDFVTLSEAVRTNPGSMIANLADTRGVDQTRNDSFLNNSLSFKPK